MKIVKDVEPVLWFVLYTLLRLAGGTGAVKVSTTQLGEVMGVSQQSTSRHLQHLERLGLIKREFVSDGTYIHISRKGMDNLKTVYEQLRKSLVGPASTTLILEGVVFTGFGEGAYYVNQEGYRSQLREFLGFEPFPGTLNVRLRTKVDMDRREELERTPGLEFKGFKTEDRSFGGGRGYPVVVNDEVEAVLVIADRTRYDRSTVEIVAPVNLRKRLSLKDGDVIRISYSSSLERDD